MAERRALLEVEELEVRYGAVPAVRGVSFELGAGEVLAIVGPNGAGKSTLLLSIMGLVRPSAGDVLVDGRSVVGSATESIARAGLALVPEGRHIFGEFSVEENIRLGMLARASPEDAERDLEWVYSVFPIVGEFRSRTAGQLSGGQQQQLAIARALVASPRVLLLDEPTLGLAPSVVSALFRALEMVREQGVTILLVEQRAQMAVQFADRSRVMRDGALTVDLSPEDATDADRLTAAYFGR